MFVTFMRRIYQRVTQIAQNYWHFRPRQQARFEKGITVHPQFSIRLAKRNDAIGIAS